MKKAIFLISILVLVALLLCPLAAAVPLKEKNNDKFQTFSVAGTFSWFSYLTGEHYYVPSTDSINKAVIEFDENMRSYDVTVGSNTYHLGTDFTYTGHATFWYFDPVYSLPAPVGIKYPTGYRGAYHAIIDYTLDFSAVEGGIDGTISLQCVGNEGGLYINSLSGTGDLQNTQVKAAVSGDDYNAATYVITIYHAGLVSGWPE